MSIKAYCINNHLPIITLYYCRSLWDQDYSALLSQTSQCIEVAEKVYEKMRLIGNNNEELTPEHYRQWPIFKEIRKEKEFAKVFKEIFDEELETNIQIKMDVRPHFFSKDGNVMVHSKDGGSFFFFFTDEDDKDDKK